MDAMQFLVRYGSSVNQWQSVSINIDHCKQTNFDICCYNNEANENNHLFIVQNYGRFVH
jgi:hypothetical protein